MGSELVKPHHLGRRAVIYVRQSTPHQVLSNQESLRLQYALRQRARELGWREADIDVIDADLGLSGAAAAHRQGFKDLVARVTLGEVGLILSTEVTRLARNCSDWYPLLDVCGHRQCLIAGRDGVYDAGSANGRLLLGLKGTSSALELHTLRGRLTAGLLAKAARGELALQLPIGLVRDASGVVSKDPDREIQVRIALVFATFLEVRTAMAVMRTLQARGLALPRRDRHGDVRWRPATLPAIVGMLKNPAYAGTFVYGRTRPGPSAAPGAKPAQQPRPDEGWRFVVRDKYPAYIEVATFGKIQALLQGDRVDPDNRLVAAELERRWEAALVELRRAEAALARGTAAVASAEPDTLDPRLRAKVVSLGQRLPGLWADPGVSRAHKKALLRCLIDKVVLRRSARDRAAVRIVWRGGAVSELEVAMPVNALAALPGHAAMEARVLALARAGTDDVAIARTLTAEGHRSARHGAAVLPSTVRGIRLRHGLKLVPRQTRWPRVAGWLTVAEVAARLRISAEWLRG